MQEYILKYAATPCRTLIKAISRVSVSLSYIPGFFLFCRLFAALFLSLSTGISAYDIETFFTPSRSAEEAVFSLVGSAEESVFIASYSLFWPDLFELLELKSHIDVRVISDSETGLPPSSGIKVKVDRYSRLFHPKFIVVDGRRLAVGSGNFTLSNMRRYHNDFLMIEDRDIASFFHDKFISWWEGTPCEASYSDGRVEAYFAPEHDCEGIIRGLIETAGESVYFALYHFTSEPVAESILKARRSGVSVHGILERNSARPHSVFSSLEDFGCSVKLSNMSGLLHDKFFVIDGEIVITGSYNPTAAARRNVECLVVVRDRAVAEEFLKKWRHIWRWKSLRN